MKIINEGGVIQDKVISKKVLPVVSKMSKGKAIAKALKKQGIPASA